MPDKQEPLLTISALTQRYGNDKIALDNLDLRLQPGIVGLLGPNGAGKSSLMRILATITQPTRGQVCWRGLDIIKNPDAIRKVLGYLPQSFGVYDNLTGREFLLYLASLKGLSGRKAAAKVEELLHIVNLTDAADKAVKGYSGGMKQRIGIAQALVNDPQLLIVDEPTVGLDPEERARFRQVLADMSGERLIILSTHIVSDVESIADKIAILDSGKLLAFDRPEKLMLQMSEAIWQVTVSSEQLVDIRERYCITHTVRRAEGFVLRVVSHQPPLPGAIPVEASLEDVFLAHTHRKGLQGQVLQEYAA